MKRSRSASSDESEASFSDDDDDDESDEAAAAEYAQSDSSGTDDDADDPHKKRALPVSERLKKVKSAYRVDAERTMAWLVEAVQAVEQRVEAATAGPLAGLVQPASMRCTLHGYQLEGLRWLCALHSCGLSGILADEMGLGKTAQSIALLVHLCGAELTTRRLFLVVAPLSTLSGWAEQLSSFAPLLRVVTHTGTADQREAARREVEGAPASPVVVLASYEAVLADAPELKRLPWAFAVVDEAHRLKNRSSALYRCLLDEMALGEVPRLLLTGTPLQNDPQEFFNLLHFVAPHIYDDADGFGRWLEGGADGESAAAAAAGAAGAAARQRRLWRPLVLRRLKADHLALPPKVERTVRVPLTHLQREWYRSLLQRNVAALGAANARGLVNVLASLRKCCNHPYLFDGVEPEPFVEGEHLVAASAKLALLDRLLVRMRARGDRVLLFCQSTMMLDVLQDYLHLRRWPYERLDGSARAEERWAAVSSFQRRGGGAGGGGAGAAPHEPFVFLLSTRAGGLGLNLTAANVVIFYDHDWNPQADSQATDRVHRLGQTRPVLVLRLVCAGTVEEVILRRAHSKMLVSRGVLAEAGPADQHPAASAALATDGGASMAAEAIKFGLAKLCAPDANAAAAATTDPANGGAAAGPSDAELDGMLAATAVGDAQVARSAEGAGAAAKKVGVGDSIYVFDGVDYAAGASAGPKGGNGDNEDEQAFKRLVSDQAAAGASGGAAAGVGEDSSASAIAGRGRRHGPPMTAAEAEIARARQQAAVEEAERVKKERAEQRKRERWRKAGYTSRGLPDASVAAATADGAQDARPPSGLAARTSGKATVGGGAPSSSKGGGGLDDDSDATDDDGAGANMDSTGGDGGDDDDDDANGRAARLQFAVGDAMAAAGRPRRAAEAAAGAHGAAASAAVPRVVLVYTDASGRWPSRGFFRSVSAASSEPQAAYEAAAENSDLSLGDAHLVECSANGGEAGLYVALLVVLKRDKRAAPGTPPELCVASLDSALGRLAVEVRRRHATVHTPRQSGGSWYSVERTLRKHLRGVLTTVYYFKR